MDDSEREAAELLIAVAYRHPDVFDALLQKPWVLDSITEHETIAIWGVRWTARESTALADTMLAKSWMQDDITRDETEVIYRLLLIVTDGDTPRKQDAIQKVIEILDMPFLDTVESADALAVRSLYQERYRGDRSSEFLRVMAHPALEEITDDEAKIVLLLAGTNQHQPDSVLPLLDTLVSGEGVHVEERAINLTYSGEVTLAIIRHVDQATPSVSMDRFAQALATIEEFMSWPLHTNHVTWYFGHTGGGIHYGTHIASNPGYDDIGYERAPEHIAHESGHLYWTSRTTHWIDKGMPSWMKEGAADFLTIISENARVGRPMVANRDQCTLFSTITELEVATGGDVHSCGYSLGQRLFLDLYLTLGEETFRPAFLSLYLKRLRNAPDDGCGDNELGICHVDAAFKANASADVSAKVDEVIEHWYYGSAATHEADRAELIKFYHATNGPNWVNSANWLSDAHIREWHGVTTDVDGRVIELDLGENGLSGQLPSSLGNLANLRGLLLSDNQLRGPIPTELGSLEKLTQLELDDNALTGEIPSSLGNLTNLTRLELDDNRLTAEIPSSLGNLTNLTYLELHGNELTGLIPSSLSNLTALTYLRLAHGNQFTGCIPVGLTDVADNNLDDLGLPSC